MANINHILKIVKYLPHETSEAVKHGKVSIPIYCSRACMRSISSLVLLPRTSTNRHTEANITNLEPHGSTPNSHRHSLVTSHRAQHAQDSYLISTIQGYFQRAGTSYNLSASKMSACGIQRCYFMVCTSPYSRST